RQMVNILSDPNGAAIFVDGEYVGKAPISNYNLTIGAHTFKAELNSSQIDEQSINITRQTTEIAMHPVKKSNVRITTKYAGSPVDALLVVDNEKNYKGQKMYSMVLPYDKHTFRVSYGGKTKEKTIKINRPEFNHEFRLSAKNDFVWPWQRDYDAVPFGVSFAYVRKQLVTKGEGEKLKENGIWDDGKDKWLHGMQIGFHANPCLSFGLGFYTGIFYEFYRENVTDGVSVQLGFSGMYVGGYDDEEVTIFDAVFYKAESVKYGSYIYDKVKPEDLVKISDLPASVYSEIALQITRATAASSEINENWRSEI
ncbi:MAG: PEGA domain-containing protein, partial [Acutalibacteraceae bacterium]